MINLMRLEVAIQGVGIAERATQAAANYAIGRRQGGPASEKPEAIANHPDVRRMLLTMRAETIAMRALVLEAALQLDLASAADDEQARRQAQYLAEFLLPICKARAAETGHAVANLAVQVFGGHGYITDNGVEQNVRDSRVLSIYEGTNGIQAIDLALRKIPGDRRRAMADIQRQRRCRDRKPSGIDRKKRGGRLPKPAGKTRRRASRSFETLGGGRRHSPPRTDRTDGVRLDVAAHPARTGASRTGEANRLVCPVVGRANRSARRHTGSSRGGECRDY